MCFMFADHLDGVAATLLMIVKRFQITATTLQLHGSVMGLAHVFLHALKTCSSESHEVKWLAGRLLVLVCSSLAWLKISHQLIRANGLRTKKHSQNKCSHKGFIVLSAIKKWQKNTNDERKSTTDII